MNTLNLFQIYKNESNRMISMQNSNYTMKSLKMYNAYIRKEFFKIVEKMQTKKVNIIEFLIEINKYEHILKNLKNNRQNTHQKNKMDDVRLIKKLYMYKIKLLKKAINIILREAVM